MVERIFRWLRVSFRGVLGVLAVLGLIETVQGAPSAVSLLADIGVAESRLLGILLAVLLTLVFGLIALGPERAKQWMRQDRTEPSAAKPSGTPLVSLPQVGIDADQQGEAFGVTVERRRAAIKQYEQKRTEEVEERERIKRELKDELQAEQRETAAVSEPHRKQLQELAAAYSTTVGCWRRAEGKQPPLLERSFWSHFPQMGRLLESWDEVVAAYDKAAKALREWLAANADGLTAVAGVYSAVEDGRELNWSTNIGYLWLDGGMGVAPLVEEGKTDELKRPYEELLIRARESPEGRALRTANLETRAAQQSALNELGGIRALHVIRGKCDLC